MVDRHQFLKAGDVANFLQQLSLRYDVFFPVRRHDRLLFRRFAGSADGIEIGEVRTCEPLKAFFCGARERVAEDFRPDPPAATRRPAAIVGAKACDLKGLLIQDFVFQNRGYDDPFYRRNREQNLIVSADCTAVLDACFCLALDVQPYPRENFDVNLSPLTDGFVVEAISPRGRAWVQEHPLLFRPVTDRQLRDRDHQRRRVAEAVEQNLRRLGIPRQDRLGAVIRENWDAKLWEEEAQRCVECGACTRICPTCHCFLLYDQRKPGTVAMERFRIWDSCLIKDYARVAGGGNPRRRLWMRLRNRFEKKFDYFPRVAQRYACTGCGRCVGACPGRIDIRQVLRRLVAHA